MRRRFSVGRVRVLVLNNHPARVWKSANVSPASAAVTFTPTRDSAVATTASDASNSRAARLNSAASIAPVV